MPDEPTTTDGFAAGEDNLVDVRQLQAERDALRVRVTALEAALVDAINEFHVLGQHEARDKFRRILDNV